MILSPGTFAIIDVETARTLIVFIEKMTATAGRPKNYDKMSVLDILKVHDELFQFVRQHDNLKGFDPDDYQRK